MLIMSKIKDTSVDFLFEAILNLQTLDECYDFFEDLCTVTEIKALSQRISVAKMLRDKKVYSDIVAETGASTALRASRYMESRKVAKMHQNVLVFYKGNTKEIKNIYPKIEFSQDELTQFDSEVNVEPENTEV